MRTAPAPGPRPHHMGLVRRDSTPGPRHPPEGRETPRLPLTPRPLALTANVRPLFRPAPVVLSFGAVSASLAPVGLWAFLQLFLRKFVVYPNVLRTFTTPEETNPPPKYTTHYESPQQRNRIRHRITGRRGHHRNHRTRRGHEGGFGCVLSQRAERGASGRHCPHGIQYDEGPCSSPLSIGLLSLVERDKGPWCLAGFDSLRPF